MVYRHCLRISSAIWVNCDLTYIYCYCAEIYSEKLIWPIKLHQILSSVILQPMVHMITGHTKRNSVRICMLLVSLMIFLTFYLAFYLNRNDYRHLFFLTDVWRHLIHSKFDYFISTLLFTYQYYGLWSPFEVCICTWAKTGH